MTVTYKELLKDLSEEELIKTFVQTRKTLITEMDVFFSPLGIRKFSEQLAKICEEMQNRTNNE